MLGGTALTQQGLLWRPLAFAVLIAWVAGAALFAGDVASRFHRPSPVPYGRARRRHDPDRGVAWAVRCRLGGLIQRA